MATDHGHFEKQGTQQQDVDFIDSAKWLRGWLTNIDWGPPPPRKTQQAFIEPNVSITRI
jgi:hypothetical protein